MDPQIQLRQNRMVRLTGCVCCLLLLALGEKVFSSTAVPVPDSLPSGLLSFPKSYGAVRALSALQIDGDLTDESWQAAPWSDLFIDIAGSSSLPGLRIDRSEEILPTRMKMCWDEQYLYIGAELKDPDLWATLRQRDTIIYHNNDFEVFLSTTPTVHDYYELEINPRGTILDLLMPRAYRSGGKAVLQWDLKGLGSAVKLHGTLNQGGDRDTGWVVELAIPYEGVLPFGAKPPGPGDYWRINFSRVHWDLDRSKEGHQRLYRENGQLAPEHNWVWSPQGIVDMHAPDRWGFVFFMQDSATKPVLPLVEYQKAALWRIYYLQRAYQNQFKKFARTLQDLGLGNDQVVIADPKTGQRQTYFLKLAAGDDWYTISLHGNKGAAKSLLSLGQQGILSGAR